jgi:hypothetical protein
VDNFSSLSWREQATFWWDDAEISFVQVQHIEIFCVQDQHIEIFFVQDQHIEIFFVRVEQHISLWIVNSVSLITIKIQLNV